MEIARLTAKRWSIKSDDLQYRQQQDCLQQCLPKELGMGRSAIFQLDEDLSYIETRYTPSRDLVVLSHQESPEPRLIVTLSLKGQSRFTGKSGNELVFNEGYTSMTPVNASSTGERQYEAHQSTLQLRFILNNNWLEKYFDETQIAKFFNKNGTHIQPTSIQAVHAAQKLLNCSDSGETSRLLMHGHSLSVLGFELSRLFTSVDQDATEYNQKDSVIAKSARDILLNEFKDPPSIEELSKRVGTNEFKLKKLFHQYFNNTPYGLLLEIRMNNAYRLLESRQCQVSVVAHKVGYSYPSNFSAAFIKHFGITPKAISKNISMM